MATKYIHFTEQQKEQARQTDIAQMLRSQAKHSGDRVRSMNGVKVLKRLPSEEICGFINMKKSAGMQLILSDGSTTKITPKRWSIFLAAVPER